VTNRLPEHTSDPLARPAAAERHGRRRRADQPHRSSPAKPMRLRVHPAPARHAHVPPACRRDGADGGRHDGHVHHPSADGEPEPIDRDYAVLLHNWALHPGTYRPDPSVMLDFDLWTMNSKVFPAIEPLSARPASACASASATCRCGTTRSTCTACSSTSPAGRRALVQGLWRPEVTEIVGVGQTRDLEFVAVPGDWAFHCHMSHHTMNAMGHECRTRSA
jgi:hypothetical protein